MEEKYDYHKIEEKWKKLWEKTNSYKAHDFSEKPKYYHLMEFPYPSGAGLHVGHCMGYGASDAYARMKRMQGFNVLFPIGWDAFGLPTENYAIKNKIHPSVATSQNIEIFHRQMTDLGYSFDFDREVNTTDPDYYKWTQWIFLQFYKHAVVDGRLIEVSDDDKATPRLAFQAEMPVNWCPSCKIVLANEEVIGGICERCKTQTEKRKQKQWMLRITAYADRLIKDLDTVDYLPQIKTQQINWIGKSTGTNIKFPIKGGKKTVLVVHGFTGSSKENWFPWIRETLEIKDYKVLIPDLPNSDKPDINEWVDALSALVPEIEGDLIVIGHSMGAIAACKFIEQEKLKTDKLILVGPTGKSETKWEGLRNEDFTDDDIDFLNKFNATPIDFGKLSNLVSEKKIYFSKNDPYIPLSIQNDYSELDADVRIFENKGHFNHGSGITEFPEIISDIDDSIEVFTTRADTLFGVTYVVLAPEHKLTTKIKDQVSNIKDVEDYIAQAKKKSDMDRTELAKEKTGVELKGIKAINPINGKEVSVWIADYVLATYGTGAVMAVPAHDERDWEFAKKYNIPIVEVIIPKLIDKNDPPLEGLETVEKKQVYAVVIDPKNNKVLARKWKKFPWIGLVTGGIEKNETIIDTAKREILEETGYINVKYTRTLGGPIEVHFHAAHKNVNRKATYFPLVFELVNDERERLSDKEAEEAETFWADWDELENMQGYILPIEHELVRDRFQNQAHAFEEYGVLINSSEYDGLSSADAKKKITEKLKEIGAGDFAVNFKLRDWIFSRQHYWGEPIPIIYCDKCGMIPLSESDLPLELPDVENYQPTDTGESPLATITDWVETKCPKCGGKARRETDTMPNWAGSSWYFIAYALNQNLNIKNQNEGNIFKEKKNELEYWMPVDLYNGGNEHTTLHLLYSRFWNKFLFDLGVVPTSEPYARRIAHGIILGPDGRKMSKSFGNVINPDDMIKQFGADTLRAYIMFIGPYDKESAWSVDGILGVHRFLNKVWENFKKSDESADNDVLTIELNKLVKNIEHDLDGFLLNTYISKMMEFDNLLTKEKTISKEILSSFAQLLAPAVPFVASELWEILKNEGSIFNSKWPSFDEKLIASEKITIMVQINGKIRDKFEIEPDTPEDKIKKIVLELPGVKSWLDNKEIKKFIIIPNKIVSIVI